MADIEKGKETGIFMAVGTAIGTIAAGVAGTALAAPAAIGAGVGLVVYGIVKLVKDNK